MTLLLQGHQGIPDGYHPSEAFYFQEQAERQIFSSSTFAPACFTKWNPRQGLSAILLKGNCLIYRKK